MTYSKLQHDINANSEKKDTTYNSILNITTVLTGRNDSSTECKVTFLSPVNTKHTIQYQMLQVCSCT